jgi:hypothetical protein
MLTLRSQGDRLAQFAWPSKDYTRSHGFFDLMKHLGCGYSFFRIWGLTAAVGSRFNGLRLHLRAKYGNCGRRYGRSDGVDWHRQLSVYVLGTTENCWVEPSTAK